MSSSTVRRTLDPVNTPDMTADPVDQDTAPRRRRPLRLVTGLIVLLVAVFGLGFVRFADRVADLTDHATTPAADGIVVFTGGQARIAVALALLADGKARRLLISGVHPSATPKAIGDGSVASDELFHCCVDLDRRASNTIGNARETAAWARRHGFGSLIVVTSSYHMPRSIAELSHALPAVRLEPYAVAAAQLQLESWWRRPETVQLLLAEYVKYLVTSLRLAVSGEPAGASDTAS